MEQQNNNQQEIMTLQQKVLSPQVIAMQDKFLTACLTARDLELTDNACAAFQAVVVIRTLKDALTDEVMKQVIMPMMNHKFGFKTDKDPSKPVWSKKENKYVTPEPYSLEVVRDCVIDAICFGLMITGNQFNIIGGGMYATREGFSALLKKIGCKCFVDPRCISIDIDKGVSEFSCKITYEYNGQKNGYTLPVTIETNNGRGQLKGKAERRAKKHLYEFLTGTDIGDGNAQDVQYEEVHTSERVTIQVPVQEAQQQKSQPQAPAQPQAQHEAPQPAPAPQPAQPAQPMTQQQVMNSAGQQAQASWRTQRSQQPQNNAPKF